MVGISRLMAGVASSGTPTRNITAQKVTHRSSIVQGASRDFNPSLPQSVVDAALKRDPLANSAEYLGLFRTDVEALLTQEAIEAVTDPGIRERAPDLKNNYLAFVDPSGGSSDSMTLAIAHPEGETQILDLVREVKPPFSPEAVVEEFASRCGAIASAAASVTDTPATGQASSL